MGPNNMHRPQTMPTPHAPASDGCDEPAHPGRDALFVGSLAKAFQVLECFYANPVALTLREIADQSGLSVSAVQRFTYTLHKLGYLDKDEQTRVYRPSLKALNLAHAFMKADRVSELATPHLLALAGHCNETVNLMMLDVPYSVYVLRMPRREVRNPQSLVGSRLLAHRSTSGLAMMSLLAKDEVHAALRTLRDADPGLAAAGERQAVLDAIDAAARSGYVLDEGRATTGEIAISAALRVKQSGRLAAVLVPAAASRWSRERAEAELVPQVVETARAISSAVNLR